MYPALDTTAADASAGVGGPIVNFPRPQKGGSSQHLMVTALGEFWRHTDRWLPVQTVLQVASDVGLTRPATTTALSRLSARGVLENDGAGRRSSYRFTAAARARLQIGFEQISAFGNPQRPWDRQWTAISFSIPETSRDLRDVFRARLRWLGFAPLHGALWVSPRDCLEEMRQVCATLGVDDVVIFRVHDADRRGKDLTQAWSVQDQAERYEPFIDQCLAWQNTLRAGSLGPAELFRIRVEAMDQWRAFPWEDPDLPQELLPKAWPLTTARRLFLEIYGATLEPTWQYLGAILGATDQALVAHLRLSAIQG